MDVVTEAFQVIQREIVCTPPPQFLLGGGGGVNLSKRRGLTGPQLLEGDYWKRGGDVFQRGEGGGWGRTKNSN